MWNWSLQVFRWWGVPVRLHWTLLLWWAMDLLKGLQLGGVSLQITLAGMGILFVHVLLHEFGHVWGARRSGEPVDSVVLWMLGGMTYAGHSDDPRTEIRVTLPGPLVNLALSVLTAGAILALGIPWSWTYLNPLGGGYPAGPLGAALLVYALKTGVMLTAFNLLVPAYPLDGGRLLLAWLTMRMGRGRAMSVASSIAIPIGVVLLGAAIYLGDFLLGIIAVATLVQAAQMRQVLAVGAEFGEASYSDRGYRIDPPRKEGFFERRRREKAEREARKRSEEDAGLRADVDAVLEKVSREGISSLSPEERRLLEKASERFRDR